MQHNLLDTHTLLWFINGDDKISIIARSAIETEDATNFVSIASLWEISIKVSLNKLEVKAPFIQISRLLQDNGFAILPITFEDTVLLTDLPYYHRDPFDRILIAQALNNNLAILSKDEILDNYQVTRRW